MAIANGQPADASDISEIVPAGTVLPYAGASAPTGYLMCDGSAVSRTTYAALFAAIGTAFGAGNGTTTFNVPDLRGRVPVGKNAGTFSTLGATGGEETHQLTATEMPSHSHNIRLNTGTGSGTAPAQHGSNGSTLNFSSDSVGSDGAHNNLQPYQVLNYIIRYLIYS